MLKAAISAFALSGAFAATCSNSNGFQITSQADLDALQNCQSIKGDVVVVKDVPSLSLPDGLSAIQGDFLVAQAISMTSLTASSLESISGKFQLLNLTILSTLNMPRLISVGSIEWLTLPALRVYSTAVATASSVTVIDTRLEDLKGFNLKSVGLVNINNNRYMKVISLGSLTSASTAISVAFNGASASVDLSSLLTVGNVSLNNVGDVLIPVLANISGSLSFDKCTSDKYAAPNLTLIQQSLSIIDNGALTEISMPMLQEVDGGFVIANNSQLQTVTGFPKLSSVGGALDVTGVFSNISFSSLSDVRGDLNIQSSYKGFTCPLDNKDHKVQGLFTCPQGATNTPTSLDGVKSSSSSTDSNGDKKKSAAVLSTSKISAFTAVVVILATLL